MKALRKVKAEFGCMELTEVPEPPVASNHVKIKVEYCGICGSDMKFYHWNMRPGMNIPIPVTFGHEYSGTIVEIGETVTGWKVGDRVVSETAEVYCGKCEQCQTGNHLLCTSKKSIGYQTDGAMAEYICVRQEIVHKIPDHVLFEEAAICEPSCVAAHAVYDKARVLPGDNVLIVGPGAIGLLVLQHVKNCGGRAILAGVSSDAERLEIGRKTGADIILVSDEADMVDEIKTLTGGKGVDIVFECSGAGVVLDQAVLSLKKQGTLVIVALFQNGEIPMKTFNTIVNNEIQIIGSYGQRFTNWDRVLGLMNSKALDVRAVTTHIFPLEQWEEAFATVEQSTGIKVLLKL